MEKASPGIQHKIQHLNRNIHPSALVTPGARVASDVVIGPFAIIGENVSIDSGTVVGPHVVVDGWTTIGRNNKIYAGAAIGAEPQDLKFHGEKSYLFIGDDNIFREYVTVSRGTEDGGGETRIGNDNLFMAYTHIAHDCQIGSFIVMANGTQLGGHVTVEDRAVIGGLAGVHQFCQIGRMAMVGAHSMVTKDVPPYILVDGNPAHVYGINVVGLRRNNVEPALRAEIQRAYRLLYASNLNVSQAIEQMEQQLAASPEIDHFLRFLRSAQRGICR